jgi:hypothetical protein
MALCVVMVPGRGGLPATYRGKPATSRSMEVPVTEPSALDADSSSAEGGTREAELLEEAADTRPEPDARNLFQREASALASSARMGQLADQSGLPAALPVLRAGESAALDPRKGPQSASSKPMANAASRSCREYARKAM